VLFFLLPKRNRQFHTQTEISIRSLFGMRDRLDRDLINFSFITIFQCQKYPSIMGAASIVDGNKNSIIVFFVEVFLKGCPIIVLDRLGLKIEKLIRL
jgi:hypothetical protein